ARLTQVGVQVHQARQGDETSRVHDLGARRGGPAADAVDHAAADQDVGRVTAQRPCARDQPRSRFRAHVLPPDHASASAPPSSRYSTAMRTLTPLATCSTIVDRAESATSAAISTPRFIGPGCITMACSGSCAIRATSRPYRRLYSRTLGKYAAFIRSCWTRIIMITSR